LAYSFISTAIAEASHWEAIGSMGVGGDARRDRYDREGEALAGPVGDLDVAAEGVGGVVELQDAVVESVDECLAVRLGMLCRHDRDEVVAADVADEGVGLADGVDRLLEARRAELDDLIAAHEPVVVVEGLEVVEVAVDEGEGIARLDPMLDLGSDPEVARAGR
jgi:hypothetical protein